ncbi:lysozyme [Sphingobium sp. YC-XJ3]|uniref:lysozyme n=1 Tax=Sphingobium sp. YC-XJ3 TaxID=3024245 RepID=UPI002360B57C|nr:lysozyme [Sphingobium sp. YC-XJ3]WDA36392.1 lysozyme [Sphingobium sp. YC-XJ3]
MTILTDKEIFDAIRERRGKSLSQADVDAINAVLYPAGGRVVSKNGLDLIKSFEGLSLKAYPDPGTGGEPITIGYGHTGGIKLGTVWTQAQADSALAVDVSRFADGVAGLIGSAPTTQGQFDAMVSLAYNVGLANFGSSTLLKKHKAGDYAGAKTEFARWNKAAGKVMAGLTRRRAAEAELYGS